MTTATSRITAQGQTSVPAAVRRKLGLSPGTVLEWETDGVTVTVRRARKYTSDDIHKVLFPDGPPKARTVEEMDEGIAEYMRRKHARR